MAGQFLSSLKFDSTVIAVLYEEAIRLPRADSKRSSHGNVVSGVLEDCNRVHVDLSVGQCVDEADVAFNHEVAAVGRDQRVVTDAAPEDSVHLRIADLSVAPRNRWVRTSR